MNHEKGVTAVIDFQSLFESAPDLYLVLSTDFVIIGASNAYISATLTRRDEIVGRQLFDVFPDNAEDLTATGVSSLSASLTYVLEHRTPHEMSVQKYSIRRPDGTFEERFWSPLNTPVINHAGAITCIIHRVEDVTGQVQQKTDMSKYIARRDEQEARVRKYIANLKSSEDRFGKIFNFSPVANVITDASNGKLMYVNNAFEQLFLFRRDDVIGKTLIEIGVSDEENRYLLTSHVISAHGFSSQVEIVLKNACGEAKNILSSSVSLVIDGKDCFMKALIDISDRKAVEETLRKTNHFLDTILENIPNMVFVKDAADLRFLRFNKAGAQLLGYNRKDLIGKNDYDFFAKEQADFFTAKDREVLNGTELLDIEEEPIQTVAGERWLHTQKIPVHENGKPLYLVGISQDITERKKQQDDIRQLNKDLEAFTYSVSHDLRAPLRAVTGFAKMLEEDYNAVFDDEGRRLLRTISRNAERMGRLIDDLLSFSRLGRKAVVMRDTDMNELVAKVVREMGVAVAHKATITIGALHQVKSDPGLMNQVLTNLVSNAIKYSSKKEDPRIDIRSEQNENETIFSVKDNGAGFDMRYVGKLFGVFQRLHTNDEFEGTGVGLAIVRRIIDKHGGRTWAEGKTDEGATIYFSLPIANK